jgi:ABC-type branched-subunit amino acid transport system ATPase component
MSLLAVARLTHHFGGLAALTDVNLAVEPGERRAIIGPNGAGKSTLFNLITGALRPTGGQVYLAGRNITGLPIYERARLGLGRTFQRNNLFPRLTVFENVYLASQRHQGRAGDWFRSAARTDQAGQAAAAILHQVGLAELPDALANTLAYGQQRALEIALALATGPKILLLDEPTAGMSPAETADIIALIEALPKSLTILIVEHDMDVVFSLADRITVLHFGQVIAEGAPADIRADDKVQEIYLGEVGR